MNYWRMQLHPGESHLATKYAMESLVAGYIGLDFIEDVGDLSYKSSSELPKNQKDYKDFQSKMMIGDWVLIITHHYPFALARIGSDYNYVKYPPIELGIWFRHFRKIDYFLMYSDFETNSKNHKKLVMTDTISSLTTESESYKLISKLLSLCDNAK